eukprot:TRINITY_DN6389_c0_g1_i1.p1 TRINITY_DN6389_c0_g1~~TRINITY_DN6389_c0_g1_i1.p1  ORF type:complete len:140 (+),score=24.75 TRINITY_DN6389_c0_g1_i1:537-956(+)
MTAAPVAQAVSLERLALAEKNVVRAVEVAGKVMEELGRSSVGPGGVRRDTAALTAALSQEFLVAMRDVQTVLREEIRSMSDYRPYDNSDYAERMSVEVGAELLACSLQRIHALQDVIDDYRAIGTNDDSTDARQPPISS